MNEYEHGRRLRPACVVAGLSDSNFLTEPQNQVSKEFLGGQTIINACMSDAHSAYALQTSHGGGYAVDHAILKLHRLGVSKRIVVSGAVPAVQQLSGECCASFGFQIEDLT